MTTKDVESQTEIAEEDQEPAVWKKPLPAGVPPTAFWGDDDQLYHVIEMTSEGGAKHDAIRPLAQTMEEARELRRDYFHPTLGLVWEGYKLATDRSVASRMADRSHSLIRPGASTPFSVA